MHGTFVISAVPVVLFLKSVDKILRCVKVTWLGSKNDGRWNFCMNGFVVHILFRTSRHLLTMYLLDLC